MTTGGSRRELILQAMLRVVGRKGYAETAVADVIAEAETSRTTFYKNFENKEECFLAAYDLLVERILDAVGADCEERLPWPERVRVGLERIAELFAAEPELGRTAIVEVATAGSAARQRHWKAVARFTDFLADGERLAGDRELPGDIALMAVGGVSGLIFDHLAGGRAEELPELVPELLFVTLAPYLGPAAAAEEMRRVAGS